MAYKKNKKKAAKMGNNMDSMWKSQRGARAHMPSECMTMEMPEMSYGYEEGYNDTWMAQDRDVAESVKTIKKNRPKTRLY